MNPATALLVAGEAEDKAIAHSRKGRHEHHEGAFEDGARVPFLGMDDVLRGVCEREEIPMHGPDYTLACRAVIEVLRVILGDTREQSGRGCRKPSRELVGSRAICLAWVLDQGLFDESPSLRRLAKRYGLSAPALSITTTELRDRFGIANGAQLAHDSHRMHFNPTKSDALEVSTEIGEEDEYAETP